LDLKQEKSKINISEITGEGRGRRGEKSNHEHTTPCTHPYWRHQIRQNHAPNGQDLETHGKEKKKTKKDKEKEDGGPKRERGRQRNGECPN